MTALAARREREGCRGEGSAARSCLGWKEGGWRLGKELLLPRAGCAAVEDRKLSCVTALPAVEAQPVGKRVVNKSEALWAALHLSLGF